MSIPPVGILQGRLTASNGRGIQFFPFEDWEKEFAEASKIGFSAIELLVKSDSYKENPLWTDAGVDRINELKAENNIKTLSVHGFYSKDESYPGVISKLIVNGGRVGAGTVLISFFKENILHDEGDKEFARKQLMGPLRVAAERGIVLGVEAEVVAEELGEFLDSFGSENIKSYYDIGNMVSMGVDVVEEVKFFGKRICGTHVKDRKLHGESVPIGEGDTDFSAVFTALKEVGYGGAFIMQGARSEAIDDIELNRRYFEYVRELLKKTYL